jgi:transposase
MSERNKKIIAAVERGMTYGQVAKQFGISRGAVAGVIDRHRRPDEVRAYQRTNYRHGDRAAAKKAALAVPPGMGRSSVYSTVMRLTGLRKRREINQQP